MYLYIKVTNDKYELPMAVASSVAELARITWANENTIRSLICRYERGKKKRSIYQRVVIEEEEV